ncbi:hypothetical protein FOMPIDRAFT_42401 [Fomitopsis schrenkii]|uniref:DUF2828 domain-containing protein n=1 Tax=Fomitopsis schrenkii TaxID=2126942 RepID=S8F9S4_FOMSC|nr:hypothetical protein FOMPIDRAFT_42401 [Fomitopsis schrenkii]
MDALKTTANRTFTENGAPAYSSTTSPTLDAFLALRPHPHAANISQCLAKAWEADAELTLRIIWNARSIHDGKGEREVFYQAFGWLYEHHPRTAIANLPRLVEPLCTRPRKSEAMPHGYWKDLLNIVALAALDDLHPWEEPPTFLHSPKGRLYNPDTAGEKPIHPARLRGGRGKARRWVHSVRAYGPQPTKVERAQTKHARLEAKLQEPKFRALYVMVARLFAEKLAQDASILSQMEQVKQGSDEWWTLSKRLSSAGKWAPTPCGSHDRVTNLSTAICLLLHESGVSSSLRINVSHDVPTPALETHVLRSFFQRWVLTPLRHALAVPEPLMSAGRWKEINYSRVASLCMKQNMAHFYKNDPDGFEAFITKVESGRKKISGATLMPHEVVKQVHALKFTHTRRPVPWELRHKLDNMQLRVLEAQWASLVQRLRESGRLDSALAVCDVSGSMYGEPIHVALALSLITAQLAKPPFSNGFITFSKNPQFQLVDVEKNGLARTLGDMMKFGWDMNTDLHAVFVKLLLPLAVENKVKPEDMIKTLFVFSDMQFDEATTSVHSSAPWETSHDAIERAYKEAGYEVPQIVYWDLAAHDIRGQGLSAIPVTANKKGVALMNGFSPAMLKVFMSDVIAEDATEELKESTVKDEVAKPEEDQELRFDPLTNMKKALAVASFDGLVVVD